MASPFVPVPVPMDRTSSAGGSKPRRPPRAASLGSVSSSSDSSSPIARVTEEGCNRGVGSQHKSRCMDRTNRSRTPPPLQNPVTPARMNGTPKPSVEVCSCPRSTSDPAGSQQVEDRPITPTVLGYEVMEERAKFTVYKILVRKTPDESWVVFRRYTDFSRLNDKLKEAFPGFRLSLPPKRWFKDNYDSDFLEDRQLGLQAFLQNLVAHKDVAHCLAVREFLCLDDPPGPFDSLEESRAFCETLEESNYRLQKELLEKQKEITFLKRKLEEREAAVLLLEKHLNGQCVSPESPCGLVAQGSDSSAEADVESSAAEADQATPDDAGGRCDVQLVRSSACWCRPSLSTSPPVIQVTQLSHQKPQQ
ncbi:sorting nexin-16 [Melanotaenia boesemani]|uniref:sorting nexin-16 n=1 Tax=Melanotaenia boesemani TaxID=1250792 RepID=UPI001C04E1F5|nr:sorting nexin-16 [Melanotaenia boesemani]XP_041824497.1 sorting nexin-16 [Melanotaenia boesemani]